MDQITQEMLNSDVLCVYSALTLYESLSLWLEKGERTLVFIEEEEETFLRAKQLPLAQNPKVRLFYYQKGSSELLRLIAWEFLYLKIGCFASSEAGKAFFQELSTYQTATFALASDWSDCGEKVVNNLIRNAPYLSSSLLGLSLKNKCKGLPAIVCGAGPSLNRALPLLNTLSDRALIFAGGTAVAALRAKNMTPHCAVNLDPDPPRARFLDQGCFEVPFFYQSRFCAELLKTVHGQRIWMPGSGNYPLEEWLSCTASSFDSGWTVGTFCLSIALHLGCDPILLTGMDFCAGASGVYASGIHGNEHKVKASKATYTKSDWLMSAEWVAACAAAHPERTLINTSEGKVLKGIPQFSFEEAVARYAQESHDIEGYLHHVLAQAPPVPGDALERVRTFQESFGKSLALCNELLALWQKHFPGAPFEDPDYTLLEADLETQVAFDHFLHPLWEMWKAPILRKESHPWGRLLHRHLFFKKTLEDLESVYARNL